MLLLTRKKNESLVIKGPCELKICKISGGRVVLGLILEPEVKVIRKELLDREEQQNSEDTNVS